MYDRLRWFLRRLVTCWLMLFHGFVYYGQNHKNQGHDLTYTCTGTKKLCGFQKNHRYDLRCQNIPNACTQVGQTSVYGLFAYPGVLGQGRMRRVPVARGTSEPETSGRAATEQVGKIFFLAGFGLVLRYPPPPKVSGRGRCKDRLRHVRRFCSTCSSCLCDRRCNVGTLRDCRHKLQFRCQIDVF